MSDDHWADFVRCSEFAHRAFKIIEVPAWDGGAKMLRALEAATGLPSVKYLPEDFDLPHVWACQDSPIAGRCCFYLYVPAGHCSPLSTYVALVKTVLVFFTAYALAGEAHD